LCYWPPEPSRQTDSEKPFLPALSLKGAGHEVVILTRHQLVTSPGQDGWPRERQVTQARFELDGRPVRVRRLTRSWISHREATTAELEADTFELDFSPGSQRLPLVSRPSGAQMAVLDLSSARHAFVLKDRELHWEVDRPLQRWTPLRLPSEWSPLEQSEIPEGHVVIDAGEIAVTEEVQLRWFEHVPTGDGRPGVLVGFRSGTAPLSIDRLQSDGRKVFSEQLNLRWITDAPDMVRKLLQGGTFQADLRLLVHYEYFPQADSSSSTWEKLAIDLPAQRVVVTRETRL
jgi:hypothetical protein